MHILAHFLCQEAMFAEKQLEVYQGGAGSIQKWPTTALYGVGQPLQLLLKLLYLPVSLATANAPTPAVFDHKTHDQSMRVGNLHELFVSLKLHPRCFITLQCLPACRAR